MVTLISETGEKFKFSNKMFLDLIEDFETDIELMANEETIKAFNINTTFEIGGSISFNNINTENSYAEAVDYLTEEAQAIAFALKMSNEDYTSFVSDWSDMAGDMLHGDMIDNAIIKELDFSLKTVTVEVTISFEDLKEIENKIINKYLKNRPKSISYETVILMDVLN